MKSLDCVEEIKTSMLSLIAPKVTPFHATTCSTASTANIFSKDSILVSHELPIGNQAGGDYVDKLMIR